MFDADHFIASRMRAIDSSGIRRVFDLAAKMKDPINLSIGQPDFEVPETIKNAAIRAIQTGCNRYTVTQGINELREKIVGLVQEEFPSWASCSPQGKNGGFGTLITSGTSGGLLLAILSCVGPGDEVLLADPSFGMYGGLVTLAGGKVVYVDTYPDFQLTAQRIEPHITPRSKVLLFNSPSNPTGVVAGEQICREVAELARRHNLLLLSDEIYDEFCYEKVTRDGGRPRCPSPASYCSDMLLLRGFSKTYGMTGWRLGYAVGPQPIIEQMTKLQQYSFVCAPSMAQVGGVAALDVDMSDYIEKYRSKRDRVVSKLSGSL